MQAWPSLAVRALALLPLALLLGAGPQPPPAPGAATPTTTVVPPSPAPAAAAAGGPVGVPPAPARVETDGPSAPVDAATCADENKALATELLTLLAERAKQQDALALCHAEASINRDTNLRLLGQLQDCKEGKPSCGAPPDGKGVPPLPQPQQPPPRGLGYSGDAQSSFVALGQLTALVPLPDTGRCGEALDWLATQSGPDQAFRIAAWVRDGDAVRLCRRGGDGRALVEAAAAGDEAYVLVSR